MRRRRSSRSSCGCVPTYLRCSCTTSTRWCRRTCLPGSGVHTFEPAITPDVEDMEAWRGLRTAYCGSGRRQPGAGVHTFPRGTTLDVEDIELWRPWVVT